MRYIGQTWKFHAGPYKGLLGVVIEDDEKKEIVRLNFSFCVAKSEPLPYQYLLQNALLREGSPIGTQK